MTDHHPPAMLPSDALAAAVVAAAELARNGGNASQMWQQAGGTLAAMTAAGLAASPTTQHQKTMSNLQPIAPLTHSVAASPAVAATVMSTTSGAFPFSKQFHDNDVVEDEDDDDDDDGSDGERRVARSRERNREHARRTRLRKKAQLEALQAKVQVLQSESKVLQQKLEECHIASILVGLSSGTQDSLIQELINKASEFQDKGVVQLVGKRKRFVVTNGDGTDAEEMGEQNKTPPQPLQIRINGKLTRIGGGKTHINWKSGVYSDENGCQRKLTREQLESLRRERNRMHAKMTRDRKKNFIATIEKTIEDLESNNARMRELVTKIGSAPPQQQTQAPVPSPPSMNSPSLSSVVSHDDGMPSLLLDMPAKALAGHTRQQQQYHDPSPIPAKRVRHGFSLSSY